MNARKPCFLKWWNWTCFKWSFIQRVSWAGQVISSTAIVSARCFHWDLRCLGFFIIFAENYPKQLFHCFLWCISIENDRYTEQTRYFFGVYAVDLARNVLKMLFLIGGSLGFLVKIGSKNTLKLNYVNTFWLDRNRIEIAGNIFSEKQHFPEVKIVKTTRPWVILFEKLFLFFNFQTCEPRIMKKQPERVSRPCLDL